MLRSSHAHHFFFFFFFNDTATTEIYTLSLHDALPICPTHQSNESAVAASQFERPRRRQAVFEHSSHPMHTALVQIDRKSTRLNSSHSQISYAVFCLKKKKILDAFILITVLEPLITPYP